MRLAPGSRPDPRSPFSRMRASPVAKSRPSRRTAREKTSAASRGTSSSPALAVNSAAAATMKAFLFNWVRSMFQRSSSLEWM